MTTVEPCSQVWLRSEDKKPSRAQNLLQEDRSLTNHFTDTAVLAPHVAKTKLIFVSDKKYLLPNIIVYISMYRLILKSQFFKILITG